MINTYTSVYVQVIFTVKNREPLISSRWEERLYQYITGIVQNKKQKMLAINGMPDHIHFFMAMNPTCVLSDLVREIKKASHSMVNGQKLTKSQFFWQEGYGAFSYGFSQKLQVIQYIQNQKELHKNFTFEAEYIEFLKRFHIPFDEKYLFDPVRCGS
jgi:putative transposase